MENFVIINIIAIPLLIIYHLRKEEVSKGIWLSFNSFPGGRESVFNVLLMKEKEEVCKWKEWLGRGERTKINLRM